MDKDKIRLNSLNSLIKANRLDGLIFFHPENILLSSGMLPGAPFSICIVTKSGQIIILCPWWRKDAVKLHSWADRVLTFDWLRNLKGADPVEEIFRYLKKLRDSRKMQKIGVGYNLGCVMPSYTPSSFFTYDIIKSGLKDVFKKVSDVSGSVQLLRAIKTPYEIKMLRRANKVAKAASRAFYKSAKPGVREIDIAADILGAVQSQAGKGGVKFTYCDPPQITSGVKRTLCAYALTCPATSRKLKKGDLVMLELGGYADGYWFDLTRTLVVGGRPKLVHIEMAHALKSASDAVCKAYRQGCNASDELTRIAFEALKEAGFEKGIVHGLGHGVGFAYHESIPGIGLGSKDIIKPGMVTSLEPGLYLPGVGGVRIEENIVWQANSVKVLSSYHNELGLWKE